MGWDIDEEFEFGCASGGSRYLNGSMGGIQVVGGDPGSMGGSR